MASTAENALTILRVMREDLRVRTKASANASQILPLTGLDKDFFDEAQEFLVAHGYVKPFIGRELQLTAQGLEYLERMLTRRYPLSRKAEIALRYLDTTAATRQRAIDKEAIKTEFSLTDDQYSDIARQLGNLGFIRDVVRQGYYNVVMITKLGSEAVQDNFARPGAPPIQSTQYFAGRDLNVATNQAIHNQPSPPPESEDENNPGA